MYILVNRTVRVVRAVDADDLVGAHVAREDAAKGVKARTIGGGDHLGDEHHQRAVGVAAANLDNPERKHSV